MFPASNIDESRRQVIYSAEAVIGEKLMMGGGGGGGDAGLYFVCM